MAEISIIIPTRNRAASLLGALYSLLDQSLSPQRYEIVVVDNGSTDQTRSIAEKMARRFPGVLQYVYEESPGLHQARHTGARVARTDILSFVDDDILAHHSWLEAILQCFEESPVSLVGGRILPKWEAAVPPWVQLFDLQTKEGVVNGFLSLADFGPERKPVPPEYVFGCNFTVLKDALYECGGFHPDSMPQELIHLRGDGETALSVAIFQNDRKIAYEPEACIYHRVPSQRLTIDYFCRRAFYQGVSDSFSEIRALGSVPTAEVPKNHYQFVENPMAARRTSEAYSKGVRFHRQRAKSDPSFLNFILRKDYF